MLSTRTENEFGTWGIPGRRPVILYSKALMSRLAGEAAEAGGNPVAGVLFGDAAEPDVRITACRPVETSRAGENDSPFTAEGEAELSRLAESWRDDPELVQLEPIGWYRSRWESPIQLDQDDLRIWNRYFPKPSQVSLVLRVQENSPVRAGFFFRPPHGGPVRIDSSYRTFEIEPWPAESTAGVGALARAVLAGGGGELVRRPPAHPHVPAPPAELFTPPERPSSRPVFFWATAGLAAAGLIGFWAVSWWGPAAPPAAPMEELRLRFRGRPDNLQLVWNPAAGLVRDAARAELRIVDGESDVSQPVAAADLLAGSRYVPNVSGAVEAQLRIHPRTRGHDVTLVAAQFIGPNASQAPAQAIAAVPVGPGVAALREEKARLGAVLNAQLKGNRSLEQRIQGLRKLVGGLDRGKKEKPVVVAEAALARPLARPEVAPPAAAAPVRTEEPPRVGGIRDPGPAFGSDRAQARAAVPAAEPAQPAYSGPMSGKFIWTGYLAPGKTVVIDGRRASTGSVNGSLPGVPVRVSVYPAEFSSSGLAVFSASPRHQGGNVAEGRSAQNGWLNTRYVYDPARARDALVSGAPGEASGYKQLQISGGERPVSVVVVEWSVAR